METQTRHYHLDELSLPLAFGRGDSENRPALMTDLSGFLSPSPEKHDSENNYIDPTEFQACGLRLPQDTGPAGMRTPLLFFPHEALEIPLVEENEERTSMDTHAWDLRAELNGVCVELERPLGVSREVSAIEAEPKLSSLHRFERRRPLFAIAASIPMFILPSLASATVMDPEATNSSSASVENAAPAAPTAEKNASTRGASDQRERAGHVVQAEPEPVRESPTPTVVQASELSLTGRLLWDALQENDLNIVMKDGSSLRGRVVTQDENSLAFARATDGLVVSVPKRDIREIRLDMTPPRSQRPRDTGIGLIVGGAVLTAVGAPILVTGLALAGVSPSYPIGYFFLLPGAGLVGAGIPMIVRGAKKRSAWKAAWQARVSGGVSYARGRWAGGLTVRF